MKKFWENPANNIVAPQGAKVPDSLQIGNVHIAPATILAPMAGVTDTVFRRFIRNASFVRSAQDVMAVPEEADCDIATSELHQVQNSEGREKKSSPVFKNNRSEERRVGKECRS